MSTEATDQALLDGFGIFGATVEDVKESIKEEEFESGDFVRYLELNPQGKQDKVDTAIVRLVANLTGGKNIVSKTSYKVKTDDGTIFMFDSAKTNGWKNPCIVGDVYSKVKDDEDKLKKFRGVFGYRKPTVVLVEVLKYDTDPTLVGSIMPLRISEDIENLIRKTISPTAEEIELGGAEAINVFDPLVAPALMLKAETKDNGRKDKDGKPVLDRTFVNSLFVKSQSYRYFLVPQKDENGENITSKVKKGDKEIDVVQFNKVELTEEEKTAYKSRNFTDAMKAKLGQIISYLNDSPKHEDFAYIEPTDERKVQAQKLVDAVLNGTPAILGNAPVKTDENTDAPASSEAAEPQAETGVSESDSNDAASIVDGLMNGQA